MVQGLTLVVNCVSLLLATPLDQEINSWSKFIYPVCEFSKWPPVGWVYWRHTSVGALASHISGCTGLTHQWVYWPHTSVGVLASHISGCTGLTHQWVYWPHTSVGVLASHISDIYILTSGTNIQGGATCSVINSHWSCLLCIHYLAANYYSSSSLCILAAHYVF